MTDTGVCHIQSHSPVFWVGEISFQVSAPEILYAVAIMFHAGERQKSNVCFLTLDPGSWNRWALVSQLSGDDVNEHRLSVSCTKGKRLRPVE